MSEESPSLRRLSRRVIELVEVERQLRAGLEDARHTLVTLSGLYVHDGNPSETWRLDFKANIARADRVLRGDAPY